MAIGCPFDTTHFCEWSAASPANPGNHIRTNVLLFVSVSGYGPGGIDPRFFGTPVLSQPILDFDLERALETRQSRLIGLPAKDRLRTRRSMKVSTGPGPRGIVPVTILWLNAAGGRDGGIR